MKEELMKLKVSELKEKAKEYNLKVVGLKKEEIVDLLVKEEKKKIAKQKREARKEAAKKEAKINESSLAAKEPKEEPVAVKEVKEVPVKVPELDKELVAFEESHVKKDINKIALIVITVVLALVLLCCSLLTNNRIKDREIMLDEKDPISIVAPGNWYLGEDNFIYQLSNDKLSFAMGFNINKQIKKEDKDSFFEDIRKYYVHQDLADENTIVFNGFDTQDHYSIFKYLPEKEMLIEFGFSKISIDDALKIINTLKF